MARRRFKLINAGGGLSATADETVTGDWSFEQLTVIDGGGTDLVKMTHDGTNFRWDATNTVDWVISGITGKIEILGGLDIRLRDGGKLYIMDATDTDQVEFAHNGTDFNTTFTNTVDWNITGLTGYIRPDTNIRCVGTGVQFYGPSEIESVGMSHNGTNFNVAGAGGTTAMIYTGMGRVDFSGDLLLWLRDGGQFRVSDASDADYVEMSHDGTDFNIAATNTTDINFTGITSLTAPSATFSTSASGTANSLNLINSGPSIWMYENDRGTNLGGWKIYGSVDNWNLYTTTDAGAATSPAIRVIRGTTTNVSNIRLGAPFLMQEVAAATADVAGMGQLWVKNTTPCELWFTDDAGTDTQIV